MSSHKDSDGYDVFDGDFDAICDDDVEIGMTKAKSLLSSGRWDKSDEEALKTSRTNREEAVRHAVKSDEKKKKKTKKKGKKHQVPNAPPPPPPPAPAVPSQPAPPIPSSPPPPPPPPLPPSQQQQLECVSSSSFSSSSEEEESGSEEERSSPAKDNDSVDAKKKTTKKKVAHQVPHGAPPPPPPPAPTERAPEPPKQESSESGEGSQSLSDSQSNTGSQQSPAALKKPVQSTEAEAKEAGTGSETESETDSEGPPLPPRGDPKAKPARKSSTSPKTEPKKEEKAGSSNEEEEEKDKEEGDEVREHALCELHDATSALALTSFNPPTKESTTFVKKKDQIKEYQARKEGLTKAQQYKTKARGKELHDLMKKGDSEVAELTSSLKKKYAAEVKQFEKNTKKNAKRDKRKITSDELKILVNAEKARLDGLRDSEIANKRKENICTALESQIAYIRTVADDVKRHYSTLCDLEETQLRDQFAEMRVLENEKYNSHAQKEVKAYGNALKKEEKSKKRAERRPTEEIDKDIEEFRKGREEQHQAVIDALYKECEAAVVVLKEEQIKNAAAVDEYFAAYVKRVEEILAGQNDGVVRDNIDVTELPEGASAPENSSSGGNGKSNGDHSGGDGSNSPSSSASSGSHVSVQ